MKRTYLLILLATFSLSLFSATSGKCGKNLKWYYDKKSQTLSIVGSGEMKDFGYNYDKSLPLPPWKDYKEDIKTLVLQEGLTKIGKRAFYQCHNITFVRIPNTVKYIGEGAFYLTSLTEISIPDGVERIGFKIASQVSNYKVSAKNSHFTAVDGVLFSKDKKTLVAYPAGNPRTEYTIPDGVTKIEEYAFYDSEKLNRVTIGKDVKEIEFSAFAFCSNIKSIHIPDNVEKVDKYAFDSHTQLQYNEEMRVKRESNGFTWKECKRQRGNKTIMCAKDINDNIIIPYDREYTDIYYNVHWEIFDVEKDNLIGACDKKGQEVVPPIYDENKSYYIFQKNGLYVAEARNENYPCVVYRSNGTKIISEYSGNTSASVMGKVIWCSGKDMTNPKTYSEYGVLLANEYMTESEIEAARAKRQQAAQQARQQRAQQAIAIMNAIAGGLNAAGNSYSSSSGSYSSSSTPSSSSTGQVVGNYTAFGLSKAYGNTVTHSQVFTVYRDSRGYYIVDPKNHTNTYLNYNSYSSYFDYSVGQYNYTFMTMLGTDIHWFVKL